jgi:hypothetical protein
VSVGAGLGRSEAVAAIADAIDAVSCSHPVRVAIDGCAAAGKTTLPTSWRLRFVAVDEM